MSESHQVRNNTLGTVIGGIILAGLGKLTGWLPQVWDFLVKAVVWLIHAAGHQYSLTLPLVAWLILDAIALWLVVRAVRRELRTARVQVETGLNQQPGLSQLEADIMALFARADGRPLRPQEITSTLNVNNLRASAAVDNLVGRRLLEEQLNMVSGASYLITRTGRDYLLKNGLA